MASFFLLKKGSLLSLPTLSMFAIVNGLSPCCISHNNHMVKCLLDMLECLLVDSDLFFLSYSLSFDLLCFSYLLLSLTLTFWSMFDGQGI